MALGALNADGFVEWLDNDQPLPASVFTNNGPAPTTLLTPQLFWGVEAEPVNRGRLVPSLFVGETNYSDWYYPSTGLLIGNSATGGANLGLDTSVLSLPVDQGGRGRSDIVNQTQAQQIDVPVIGFGGTNGLTPVPGVWRSFANAIAPCASLSCDGTTTRMVTGASDLSAFPTFGGPEGGFEVHMSEGYSHNDVLAADDDATNNVIDPLLAFMERNAQ